MIRVRTLAFLFAASMLALNAARPSPAAVPIAPFPAKDRAPAGLSVMTYNVEGLPFPAAYGRADKEAEIGEHLAQLRMEGRQPHVVLLQEAFIPQAKAIARAAGYTYVAHGPGPSDSAPDRSPTDVAFAERGSWLKGEGLGKWVDSGLLILSDYPIVQTRKMAFPQGMCAGFDCLASKGVLIAWIKVPGEAQPVAVADTHLNSRATSGVAVLRADTAYLHQTAMARAFVRANVPASTSLVFGGDFNVGHDRARIAAQAADGGMAGGGAEATTGIEHNDAVTAAPMDRAAIVRRAKDKQYYRPASGRNLILRDFQVPFGPDNRTLSDHLPFIADYSS